MKSKLYISILATSLLTLGCSDDYLETKPTEFISSDQIIDASDLNSDIRKASLRGIYATMFKTGSGGTDLNHDDFGQKGYDIYGDMLSSDMVLGGTTYGWYSTLADMTSTVDYTNINNYKVWRFYYRIILSANIVIDGLGGNDAELATTDEEQTMGQAKAMRAYAYFYLANYFSQGYQASDAILPIYTDTNTPNQPLSTAQEVYDLIITDLNEAVTLLEGFSRTAKNEVNQDVARGLLAYAYAAIGKNAEAAVVANKVITDGNYTLMSKEEVTGGFNDVITSGWMWGVDLTLDNDLDLVSWWGQMDLFTYSYTWAGDPKVIDENLYAAIPSNDVRKAQFEDQDATEDISRLYPTGKFYAPERKIGGQRSVTTDYVYMRIAEMYLLHAETAAKSGDEAGARASLKTLLKERLDSELETAYVDLLSGQALLDEIYLQTRIELWGEGKSYLAMKRNKATITRGPNHLSSAGTSIPYNDDRLSFDIPQSEIQNNPNISQ
ncbi:RagB/SusD family nutrient uptake outer membrane protein [Arenibacter sp. 6A1]|uniref:RagB/SusD family nutrient uptake outer membrane protein n=1 Tax=Arenibacter sp. 6A1 TaxID=2720391 RepID=UPI001445D41E|nr:RagB/SusD family nutrient uptake outer membrane protein [Arenibacter sp. 6A1]NKI26216.1 RagB/SusD family nutrient uptake outer membrane protein [Arenibacter sp. 6A1]